MISFLVGMIVGGILFGGLSLFLQLSVDKELQQFRHHDEHEDLTK
jgi:uncharacterized membrane protein YciS (DUF1049 family)